jgi:hypothetical protein
MGTSPTHQQAESPESPQRSEVPGGSQKKWCDLGDFTIKNWELGISNVDLTMNNGDLAMEPGDFIIYKWWIFPYRCWMLDETIHRYRMMAMGLCVRIIML